MAIFRRNESGVYQACPLLELDWLEHGFGSAHSVDWNSETDLVSLSQIHSDICVFASGGAGRIGRGDALVTVTPGLRIGVRTADCVPVLLVDPVRRAVAAVHAGWRGTAQAISAKVVARMREGVGSSPGSLVAAIGPGIGPCCYEVGPEVASQFGEWFPERHDLDRQTRIDLAEANRRQLLRSGLRPDSVCRLELCTCCSGGEFHSWRRNGARAGRMVAAARILEKEKGAAREPRPSPDTLPES